MISVLMLNDEHGIDVKWWFGTDVKWWFGTDVNWWSWYWG